MNPSGHCGGVASSHGLQSLHGIPGPMQLSVTEHARGLSSHGRSSCLSQTHPVPSQRLHSIMIAARVPIGNRCGFGVAVYAEKMVFVTRLVASNIPRCRPVVFRPWIALTYARQTAAYRARPNVVQLSCHVRSNLDSRPAGWRRISLRHFLTAHEAQQTPS